METKESQLSATDKSFHLSAMLLLQKKKSLKLQFTTRTINSANSSVATQVETLTFRNEHFVNNS